MTEMAEGLGSGNGCALVTVVTLLFPEMEVKCTALLLLAFKFPVHSKWEPCL
jgi:hypothetical protein